MTLTLAESLTEQFYAWEKRGRGWQAYPFRVGLEPPFVPFARYSAPRGESSDDGRQPTILEKLANWWRGRKASPSPGAPTWEEVFAGEPEADECKESITEIQVRLPPGTEISGELADQLLLAVASVSSRSSFELLGTSSGIVLQYAVPAPSADATRRTLEGYVPGAIVTSEPVLLPAWQESGGEVAVVDFGLRNEFMLPLAIRRSLSIDPLLGIITALEGLRDGEMGLLQVLFQPVRAGWAVSSLRAMSDGEGRAFFADAPETLALTREKLSRPLLSCVVRATACADSSERAWDVVKALGRALVSLHGSPANELVPLENEGYDDETHADDVLERATHRTGMLLSSAELSGLVHLPAASVAAEDLRAHGGTSKAAPPSVREGEVILGENLHKGRSISVRLRSADRMRHMHLIGATGTGKSTLLKSLIQQDLEAGRGVALLDPHGDLADEVLSLVPEARQSDVVLFDPADEEFPVGFNVLDAHSDRERELLSSDLVGVFRRFSTSWGDQMSAVLGNAVLAFLESKDGGSLLDLRRFLMDRDARNAVLATVGDPLVVSFWKEEFPRLSGRPQMPIITRLDAFLRPKCIRNIVSQRRSRFDLGEIMDRGGIFIARLSQGAIGEQNAYLLGSLLVAKFQQAAMARERQAEVERRPFFLYLDEFHHFTTPSITALLSGARKYRLGLVLAHQELRQLGEHDIRSAVLANAGTRVCFRVGDEDARTLASGFRAFDAGDLMSLGVGEAICRISQADQDFNLRCPPPATTPPMEAKPCLERIRGLTRQRYAVARSAVEETIAASHLERGAPAEAQSKGQQPTQLAHNEGTRSPPAGANGSGHRPSGARPPVTDAPAAASASTRTVSRKLLPTPGRGGPEHKYLQSLIKSYAEGKGFRATIESPVEGGGSIDVLLQRDALRFACEISVTTDTAHEIENARKCLSAGASKVIFISPSSSGLKRLEKGVAEGIPAEELVRLSFLSPSGMLALLDEQVVPGVTEASSVLGYKVKTVVRPEASGDGARSQSVAQTIVQAMRRLKGK